MSKQDMPPTEAGMKLRVQLPNDISQEELWWLYHNFEPFHAFIERMIAEAELNWQRHHNWEKAQ